MNDCQPRPIVIVKTRELSRCTKCDARGRSVCSAIDMPDLQRLSDVAVHRSAEKGRVFIEEGMPAADFFNVTSGTVKLFKTLPDGRQQITGFATVGHFLGLAVSDTYSFSAQAIEGVELCRFSRQKLRVLLHDFPALEQRLLDVACSELAAAQEQMLLLGRKTARERLASFLMSRLDDAKICGAPGGQISFPMTRAEIADYLGLTIETISRTISKFKAENKITIPSRDTIMILDPAWMADVAAGNEQVSCLT